MSEPGFEALAVIALRKSKFYSKVRKEMLVQKPGDLDEQEFRRVLRKATSLLDNTLFLSEEEKRTKVIDPTARIESLGLDARLISSKLKQKIAELR